MILPSLPAAVPKYKAELVALRGVNYSDDRAAGDLLESENLSTRRWPVLCARNGRTKQTAYTQVTALGVWEGLVAVRGTDLIYDGENVGTVTAGAKQFAVVNTRLVIWPDRVYLDMTTRTIHPIDAAAEGTGATFTAGRLTVTGSDWPALDELFQAGDTVELGGCSAVSGNNKYITIRAVGETTLDVDEGVFSEGTETGALTVTRQAPEMDFICAGENRLWGCSNSARSVYASALGDPTNFYTFEGISTDSYAAPVGSEGDFTGCCRLSGAVLFWKETRLHKVLGSTPEEFQFSEYTLEGVRAGCERSMTVINDTLYYMGTHGVFVYGGGTPYRISQALGNRAFTQGVAGSDGKRYYLSVLEGTTPHLLVYDLERQIWLREDSTRCVAFARIGTKLYFADSAGDVYLADNGAEDPNLTWTAHFAPLYETIAGRKHWRKLLLRIETPAGKTVKVAYRPGQGPCWIPLGSVTGRLTGPEKDTVPFRIPAGRADRMELRLTGSGASAVLEVSREFSVGSDR